MQIEIDKIKNIVSESIFTEAEKLFNSGRVLLKNVLKTSGNAVVSTEGKNYTVNVFQNINEVLFACSCKKKLCAHSIAAALKFEEHFQKEQQVVEMPNLFGDLLSAPESVLNNWWNFYTKLEETSEEQITINQKLFK